MKSSLSDIERLRSDCRERILRSYASQSRWQAEQRLDHEFALIEEHGHLGTFRSAVEFSRFAAKEGFFHRLRGSGSCSLIAYLLGLTDVDPLRHDLPAERLLGSTRQVTLSVLIDARHADDIRRFSESLPDFEQCLRMCPAYGVEMLPHRVAEVIRQKCDPAFELRSLPTVDARTGALLTENPADELFELATEEFWQSLRTRKTCRLVTIAALLAAHEEVAAQHGMPEDFLLRSAGRHRPGLLKVLVPDVLADTHGLLLYQEQIMLVLDRLGEIPLREGYEFVKLVAIRRNVDTYRQRFLHATASNGFSAAEAEGVFSELVHSAPRVSCKAHHLATALTIWQSAFLKTRFPAAFSQALRQEDLANA